MVGILFGVFPVILHAAEDSLSVTVTPPLFQLTIGPGEAWTSTLKIVNNNSYDVTYYASPMDFEAEGEAGKGRFMPLIDESVSSESGHTLGHWIEISPDPIVVKRGMSGEVPFTVRIPEQAAPGGHYAAILVGTKPENEETLGPSMKISSFVSSLLFVRIKGEVTEKGRIREFRSANNLYETPHADFLLRFENIGNTHLKPQGDITLYNMWGKERGKITFNQANNFGNVLPNSIRKFEFSWEGEESIFEIGRYSAVVTLGYGQESKQNSTATTYFWVVPIVPVAMTLGSLTLFIVLITWLIRRYIRRALALEKRHLALRGSSESIPTASLSTMQALIEPIKEGVVDLRTLRKGVVIPPTAKSPLVVASPEDIDTMTQFHTENQLTLLGFLQKYSLFLFFLALLAVGGLGMWAYFENVLLPERAYQIIEVTSEEEDLGSERAE